VSCRVVFYFVLSCFVLSRLDKKGQKQIFRLRVLACVLSFVVVLVFVVLYFVCVTLCRVVQIFMCLLMQQDLASNFVYASKDTTMSKSLVSPFKVCPPSHHLHSLAAVKQKRVLVMTF
jgi:hypothetical protein